MSEDSQLLVIMAAGFVPIVLAVIYAILAGRRKGEPVESNLTNLSADRDAVAARLGMELSSGWLGPAECSGVANGRPFDLTFHTDQGSFDTTIVVALELPEGVRIRAEGFLSGRDPEVGIEPFDSVVRLSGDPAWLSAALTPDARSLLIDLQSRSGYNLTPRGLRVHASLIGDGTDVDQAVDHATRLATLLELSPDAVPARLAQNACGGGRPSLLAALRLLAHYPSSPEALALAKAPPEGAEAFAALVLDRPDAELGLHRALISPDAQVALAAIALLAERGTAVSVQPLRDAASGAGRVPTKDAVQAIQGRAGPANAGGLAVVAEGGEGGELALSGDERGQLGLVKTPN